MKTIILTALLGVVVATTGAVSAHANSNGHADRSVHERLTETGS